MKRAARAVTFMLVLLAVALNVVPWPEPLVEQVYLGFLLPTWSALTAPLVDSVQASLSGLLLIGLVCVPLAVLTGGGRRWLKRVLRFYGFVALVLVLLFPLTFGLGYRLTSLDEAAQAATGELADTMRQELQAHVLARLQGAAALLASSPLGTPSGEGAYSDPVAAASACVADLARELRPGYPEVSMPSRIKPLPAGLMLRFGFAGVVSPWLLEPHVDSGLPAANALAVALHELAHSAGFAPEAQAEAVGLVAGLECSDQRVAYAAALRLAAALARAMPPEARAAFQAAWPRAAVADTRAASRATERFADPSLASGAGAAYELYLRSQGEAAGLGEYDRGTELALKLLYQRQLQGTASTPAPRGNAP